MPAFSSIPPSCNIALVDLDLHGVEGDVIRGLHRFGRDKGWNFHLADNEILFQEIRMNREILSGVIASVKTPERAEALRELGLPTVNVCNRNPEGFGLPAVVPDEEAIARLAMDHLIERGFRRFAVSPLPYQSNDRCLRDRVLAFSREARSRGYRCFGLEFPKELPADTDAEGLDGVLSLQALTEDEPLALFTANDRIAERWMFLIRLGRMRVPDQLAVLGCGNSELLCGISSPPLSSVRISGEDIGLHAAEMLMGMMRGKSAGAMKFVPPAGIEVRQSTHFIAVNTPLLSKAMMYIVEHVHEPVNAADVVRACATNRRKLERLFKEHLNRTILEQIYQVRIARAKRLLEDGAVPISDVAQNCGFPTHNHLCRVFKRYGEPPPSHFRRHLTQD